MPVLAYTSPCMRVQEPDLVTVPAGPFRMGSDAGHDDERPEHEVMVEAFRIGACPVTQAEYAEFVRATARRAPGVWEVPAVAGVDRLEVFRRAAAAYVWTGVQPPPGLDLHPVVLVTFDDAIAYCHWLSEMSGRTFVLPTEAQWEKAARGGLAGQPYPWGDSIDGSLANFRLQAHAHPGEGTAPARACPQNAYGLYGMAGNTWDWVVDWYAPGYDLVGDAGPVDERARGRLRVVRGGGWTNVDVSYLRCACRMPVPPDTYSYTIGFRVACLD
jgi:formylglycine-generating enzyme